MAIEDKKKAIGDNIYIVTQMDAITAMQTQVKLLKILGPGIPSIASAFIKCGSLEKMISLIKSGNALELVAELFKNIDNNFVSDFILSLFDKGVFIEKTVDGVPFKHKITFTPHFDANLSEAWKVVAFILEVNFNLGELLKSSGNITEDSVMEEQQMN